MELLGAVASAASLVDNCLEIIAKIQSGRRFDSSFRLRSLDIDAAEELLAKWFRAVDMNSPVLETPTLSRVIEELLENIYILFEEVKRSSEGYNRQSMIKGISHLTDQVKWAVIGEKTIGERVTEILHFIDVLYRLYPIDTTVRTAPSPENELTQAEQMTPSITPNPETPRRNESLVEFEDSTLDISLTFPGSLENQKSNYKHRPGQGWGLRKTWTSPSVLMSARRTSLPAKTELRQETGPRRASAPTIPTSLHGAKIFESFRTSGAYSSNLALALDGKRLAYLTESAAVRLFNICPEKAVGADIFGEYTKVIELPDSGMNKWESIAISGDYLAIWGGLERSRKSVKGARSLLHVRCIFEDPISGLTTNEIQLHRVRDEISRFDHRKRVAISRLGFIAFIERSTVNIVAISNNEHISLDAIKLGSPVIDVAFNELGNYLYAWVMEGKRGALFSWEISRTNDLSMKLYPVMKSEGYYEFETSDHVSAATLFPYKSKLGCIIGASGGQKFFPAVIKKPGTKYSLPRLTSKVLERCEVAAAYMLDNGRFITVERDCGWPNPIPTPFRIQQYPVQCSTSKVYSIETGRELYKLQNKPTKGLQLGVFVTTSGLLLLLCHVNGWIESARVPNAL